jgi:dipeptidase E
MCELPWKSVGILELTALQSLDPSIWLPALQAADVLLVNGGDPMFLHEWMRRSGVAELLPTLKAVYVGMSAGSMIMAKNIGKCFVGWKPSQGGDETLGVVDFAIFPHLNHPELPDNNLEQAQKWAAGMNVSTYVIDDQTAIVVKSGEIRVVSEGQWHHWPLPSK